MLPPAFQISTPPTNTQHGAMLDWRPPFLGIDVVSIARIKKSLADFGERFERRIFTPQELRDAGHDAVVKTERLAARFAAKEAAIKAFSLGSMGVNWHDLEVVRRPDGAPILLIHGRTLMKLTEIGITSWALSLSHDGDHATAVVAGLQSVPVPFHP